MSLLLIFWCNNFSVPSQEQIVPNSISSVTLLTSFDVSSISDWNIHCLIFSVWLIIKFRFFLSIEWLFSEEFSSLCNLCCLHPTWKKWPNTRTIFVQNVAPVSSHLPHGTAISPILLLGWNAVMPQTPSFCASFP